MGSAPSRSKEETCAPDDDTQSVGTVTTVAGSTAVEVAALLLDIEHEALLQLSQRQQGQIYTVSKLLHEDGWKPGKRKHGVKVQYKFSQKSKLFYSCFSTSIADTADSIFKDFNTGCAQQRYSEVCSSEEVLELQERVPPLGHERLVRGYYRMPYPMQARDFVWDEWCALLPTTDGGQLYISVAQSPENEEEVCPAEPAKCTRGHLELSATVARQAPGESSVQAAFMIQGDIKGQMPKSLQNLLAGNASSYLANFKRAHTPQGEALTGKSLEVEGSTALLATEQVIGG